MRIITFITDSHEVAEILEHIGEQTAHAPSLTPTDPVEVRTFQSFVLTYTVGTLGIDDTGGIRIAWRTVGDTGRLQTADPAAPNYVTAESNGEGRLSLE